MTARILRRPQVEEMTGLGRSAIYEYMARGEFPRPIRLSGKSVGWLESEVGDWIKARIAERDMEAA
jgi:prophage regulatory protein